eukprot:g31393.t1
MAMCMDDENSEYLQFTRKGNARAGQGRPTGEHHRKPDARNSFVHVELKIGRRVTSDLSVYGEETKRELRFFFAKKCHGPQPKNLEWSLAKKGDGTQLQFYIRDG